MNTEKKACTCGPNGTLGECAAELRAGGWCPRNAEVRAAMTAETPGGGGLTEALAEHVRLAEREWPDRLPEREWFRRLAATAIEWLGTDAAAAQACAEVVARVEALDGLRLNNAVMVRVDDLRAALAGPNPRGGQDGGGE